MNIPVMVVTIWVLMMDLADWEPNAKTPIVSGDGQNIRPVRIIISDVDA